MQLAYSSVHTLPIASCLSSPQKSCLGQILSGDFTRWPSANALVKFPYSKRYVIKRGEATWVV